MSLLDDLFSTLADDLRKVEHALLKASSAFAELEEADPDNPVREQAEAAVAAALRDHHEKNEQLVSFLEQHHEYQSQAKPRDADDVRDNQSLL